MIKTNKKQQSTAKKKKISTNTIMLHVHLF